MGRTWAFERKRPERPPLTSAVAQRPWPGVQAKLSLSTPGDAFEQEAERTADAFVHQTGHSLSASRAPGGDVQRACAHCEEEQVQRSSVPGARHEEQGSVESHVESATRGGGQPLPASTRERFEPFFGHDFSRVRIHTDEGSTRAMRAEAFTLGQDIVFRTGRYQPDSPQGQHLLAHELTHVVQQRAATPLSSVEEQGSGTSPGASVQRQTDEAMPAAAPATAPTATAAPATAAPPATAAAPATAPATTACALTTYTGSNFVGDTVTADTEFVDSLETINTHASTAGVNVHVTDSFREAGGVVSGAIVPPATKSNHLAGHAIDMNVVVGTTFYNSKKLKKSELTKQPKAVQDFIQAIRDDSGLRWGGDFTDEDPVHIDDNLNSDTTAWDARYKATQQARKDKCG